MPMRLRFLMVALILSVIVAGISGCGSSSLKPAPIPAGPFSNASLNGTYALAISGTNSGGFFSIVGSLAFNGAGNVTGGVVDINTASGVFVNQNATGSYTIRTDGQGISTITTPAGSFVLDFCVVSGQRALVTRFENGATASGTLDRQDATAFTNATLNGSFAFNVSGVDGSALALQTAATLTANGAGAITSGIEDSDDNGIITTSLAVTGTYTLNTANGRGTATLSTTAGTTHFAFYIVDANHLKVQETDTFPVQSGDAFRQVGPFSNASVTGQLVFTVGGARGNLPYGEGGVLFADGAGNITSGLQDLNNGGVMTQGISTTGAYSVAATGRGTMTLNGTAGTTNYAIYPSTGGLQMIELDVALVNGGQALSQTGSFSVASIQGPFSFNLTGATPSGEVDAIAQITLDGGGNVTGVLDVNNVGVLSQSLAVTGTYTMASSGRGTMQIRSSFGTQNFVIYAAGTTRLVFLETDSNLVSEGTFEHQ